MTDAELIEKADALAEQFAVDKHARREISSAILDALKRVRDELAELVGGLEKRVKSAEAEAAQLRQRVATLEEESALYFAERNDARQRVADLEKDRYSAMPPLPPKESDGDGCQACIDGVDHVSCEPYFVPSPSASAGGGGRVRSQGIPLPDDGTSTSSPGTGTGAPGREDGE